VLRFESWFSIDLLDEVPVYFGQPGKSICPTNAKAVRAIAPPSEGKRLATIDPFFDSNGLLLLPLGIILMGSVVCRVDLVILLRLIF
jgi:hypothetical protein